MSDEKTTIYISPEEDLTSIRERLEKIPARFITLVIPTETQLRSHVAWKLLRARVRELGKEVQIVSTNPQIRSVAKDVNFKVAPSLEASPIGKSRPPSRGGRPATGKSRPGSSQQQRPGLRGQARDPERTRQPRPANLWPPTAERPFAQSGSSDAIVEDDSSMDTPHSSTSSFNESFNTPQNRNQAHNFHMDTLPPIRPVSSQPLDEEQDPWFEDFSHAQNIREAASQSGSNVPEDTDDDVDAEARQSFRESPPYYPQNPPHLGTDPFTSMNDSLPPPSLEQQGSIPAMDHFSTQEHVIQDVPDMPSGTLYNTIEESNDQEDFSVHSDTPPPYAWGEPIAEDEQDRVGPPRAQSLRPRGGRTGRRPSPQQPPAMPGTDLGSDDALPSISDRPTHITPQTTPGQPAAFGTARPSRELHPQQGTRMSGGLPSTRTSGVLPQQGTRMSGGLPSTRTSGAFPPQGTGASGGLSRNRAIGRDVQARPASGPASRSGNAQTTTGRTRAMLSRPGTRSGRGASPSRQGVPLRARGTTRRQGSNLVYGVVAGIVVIIVVFVILYFLVPAANVTVVLPAQNYSAPVKLSASPNSQTDGVAGTIQAPTLKKDFTSNGTGKASGTTKVNTGVAGGVVFFINNGKSQITIPSNIEVATSNGVVFVTQSNVAVGAVGSNSNDLPSTIQAKASGGSGNVAAGSITVIPTSSLNQIAQANNVAVSALNLQVTNVIATSGGGARDVPMVTQKDLDSTQAALSAQLQDSVNAWLKTQLAPSDVAGKPVVTPKLTQAPSVNTTLQNGDTFPASLAESVEVPVVRGAVLQAVTMAQLNIALGKTQPNQQLASATQSSAPPIQIPSITPVSNGLSMTLSFTATGKSVPKISIDAIQSKIHGQTASDAEITLKRLLPAIERVTVKISPSFLPWIPQVQSHITVNFVGQ